MKAGFVSLGCAKNLVDTEVMLGIMQSHGIELTTDPADADILIVNTCAFIASAKEESITTILNLADYKESGRCRSLIIAGCLGQRYRKELLDEINAATGVKRSQLADQFLALILDQDRLCGTRSELRLGRWTEAARSLGTTSAEKDLYEKNARMLLTTWGDRAQCENGGLHDYANREWNGLLSSYYYPRWRAFFNNDYTKQDWFTNYEWPFANGTSSTIKTYLPTGAPYNYGSFSSTAEGDEIEVANELFDKYLGK